MGGGKTDVWASALTLMVLKTLETMGSMHGYGIAQTNGGRRGSARTVGARGFCVLALGEKPRAYGENLPAGPASPTSS